MAEYDGSFTIPTGPELDPKLTRKFASDLKKEMQNIVNSLKTDEITDEMQQVIDTVEDLISRMDVVNDRMEELENTRIPTKAFTDASNALADYQGRVDRLTARLAELEKQGKGNTGEAKRFRQAISTNNMAVERYKRQLEELEKTGKAYTPGDQTAEYKEQARALEDLANKTLIAKNRLKEMANNTKDESVATGKADLALNIMLTTLRSYANVLKQAASNVKNLVVHMLTLIKNSIVNGIKRLAGAVGLLGRQADNSTFSFGKLFKTLMAYGIGIASLTAMFNKLRSAIMAGLSDFAQMDNGMNIANSTLSQFTTSLNYLRNSVAAAFLPIIQIVQPIITGFIDRLANAISYIGAFVRAIQGFTTYAKANKVEKKYFEANNKTKQENAKTTAKNTGRTNANTRAQNANTKAVRANSNALKKQKDTLAGFDDLDVLGKEEANDNVLNPLDNIANNPKTPNTNDITQPIKDATDAIDDGLTKLDKTFEEHADIPDWIKNLADKIKEFIDQDDWYGLGAFLGEKFNGLLKVVDDWINNVLRPEGVKWAGRIAELLNGLVDSIDWELLGKTLADGINAIFDIVNTFLTTFDFLRFGQKIGLAIKSWFDNVEWDLIGQTFANYWNALIHFIQGIVTTPGIWTSIGTSIGTFVKNIFATLSIDDLATTLIAIFNGIFEMIRAFLAQDPFEGCAEKIYNGLNRMIHEINWAEAGKTLSDLVISLLNVFMEVAENTDWFAFGQAIGDFLASIDWVGIIGRVGKILWEVFSGVIAGLFSTDSGKVFLAVVAGLLKLKLAFAAAQAILFPALQQGFIAKLSSLLVGGMGGAATSGAAAVGAGIATTEGAAAAGSAGILGIFGKLAAGIKAIFTGIATALGPTGLLVVAIVAAVAVIGVLIYKNWDTISAFLAKCGEWLKNLFNKLPEFIQNVLKAVANILIGMINFQIAKVELFANVIISIINGIIQAINTFLAPVDGLISAFSGGSLSISIPMIPQVNAPRIPYLAQGAVIPPNREFLAMLGDQRNGTNIEAPLDTIVDAFRQVVGNMQVQNTGYSEMILDGQTFARLATPYMVSELSRQGYNVNVLEA